MPLGIQCCGCTKIPFIPLGSLAIPVRSPRGISIKWPPKHLIRLTPCASMPVAGPRLDGSSELASSFNLPNTVHMSKCLLNEGRAVLPARAFCHLVGGNHRKEQ
ncbi:hypothetical protein HEP81_08035 (plasmid) [Streptomyces griseofuscus]|uniref:Uncharacterized protein n=1 Tax=Streptomyces griseofuscus TaxID=146922 RepID=A0A7H1QD83_9ACTN|nr:hypothetical protein HEP81_08035 [Streptomyces griseofuscus]